MDSVSHLLLDFTILKLKVQMVYINAYICIIFKAYDLSVPILEIALMRIIAYPENNTQDSSSFLLFSRIMNGYKALKRSNIRLVYNYAVLYR